MSFVFDGHSDMWCNITMRRLAGERNVFKKYHLPHLQEGNVGALIAAVWIETQYTDACWKYSAPPQRNCGRIKKS